MALLAGCTGTVLDRGGAVAPGGDEDAATSRDTGSGQVDADRPDAAGASPDAGLPGLDAGAPGADAGPVAIDAGPPPRCADPPSCDTVSGSAVERHLVSLDGCAFALAPTDLAAESARVDAMRARTGPALGVADVLGHLNREARAGVSADTAHRMRHHDFTGFRWNSGDEGVTYWYPQGITGSSDARADGLVAGRRLILVSWYHKTDARPTKGARLSLVDVTDPSAIRYRHLLLVTPTGDGADVNFGPAEYDSGGALHAGGIAWVGDHLYVADTAVGLRVYDLSRIFEVTHSDDNDRIGISAGRVDAHGYRYAVPQIGRYRLTAESCRIRFSFVALDRSADPPVLVTGEYHRDHPNGRLARWPIDLATGWLAGRDGRVHAIDAALGAQTRMQGAVTYEGVYYISSSSQYERWGRLYRNRPGLEAELTAWPYGCEDLYVERDARRIWTSTEHPGTRDTIGIPMQGR